MTSPCVSIVRIGPAKTAPTLELQQALLSFLNGGVGCKVEGFEPTLHIANRYFQAKIRLETIGSNETGELWKEDGIILVFANEAADESNYEGVTATATNTRQTSFDSLSAVHQVAANDDAGDLLRLCVGVSSEPLSDSYKATKDYEQEYSRRIHWCLDRGYEYVECDLQDLHQGHDERDKEGFPRIVEAMRGTVWSSAIMESKKETELKQSYQLDKLSVDAQDDSDYVNEYEPPDPSTFPFADKVPIGPTKEKDKQREEKARQILLAECDGEPAATGDSLLETEQQQERQEEKVYNTMESTLKQAAQIREASRAGGLTDDERRKRAGDAATLLFHLMDQVGFDESEDEVEEHSDVDTTDGTHEETAVERICD